MAAGLNGLTISYRTTQNKRIHKYSVLIKSASTTTQNQIYVDLPASANAAPVMGVNFEHFVEPNYFVAQGTAPTAVTGSTPAVYDMSNRAIALQKNGQCRCILSSDGAVAQGDLLLVADVYGRVNNLSNLSVTTAICYAVGYADNAASNANDILVVNLDIGQRLAHL